MKAILAKLDELAKDSKSWRRWRAILATAIHTGMRASEIRGLPWSSIDLKAGKVSVTQRADENGAIGALKSKFRKARHQHTLPAWFSILLEWKAECPHGDLAFPTGRGNPESFAEHLQSSLEAGAGRRASGRRGITSTPFATSMHQC